MSTNANEDVLHNKLIQQEKLHDNQAETKINPLSIIDTNNALPEDKPLTKFDEIPEKELLDMKSSAEQYREKLINELSEKDNKESADNEIKNEVNSVYNDVKIPMDADNSWKKHQ